jgi:hypothetical protein
VLFLGKSVRRGRAEDPQKNESDSQPN